MISFQNFSFRYEESKDFTLRGIDMTVQTGEFILLTGRSGCGKTTLIRSLNGLIPHFYPGEIQGDLLMDGHSLLEMKPSELAGQVGTVFQDPRSQFFMTDTTRELAFGCENLGLAREKTIERIAKAAKELFVTQPSISNAIKALEEEFGVNLFFRNNNKLTLTPEGELFYNSAEELLAHADSVESEFHELRKKITPIRIGIPPMLGTIYLPELYFSLKENFPEVEFRLYEFGSIKACDLVLEEKLDIAIVNAEQPSIDKCNSRIIDTEDLLFCVAPDHPLAGQKTLLLTMLADEPLILFNTDSVQVMTLTRQFKAVGVNPHILLNTSQITTLLNMVKSDRVGTFLYRSIVEAHPDIVGIPVMPSIEQRIGVIWKKGKYQNATTEKVIKFIENF